MKKTEGVALTVGVKPELELSPKPREEQAPGGTEGWIELTSAV